MSEQETSKEKSMNINLGGIVEFRPISLGELMALGDVTFAVDATQDNPGKGCVIYADGEAAKPVLFLERSVIEKIKAGDTTMLKSIEIVELPPNNDFEKAD